jgi:hypothetical protein
MSQQCRQTLHVCALRAARLEPNGVPKPGANNLFVAQAPLTLGVAFEVEPGQVITTRDACGNICVRFRGKDKVVGATLTPQLCALDNELIGRMTGGTVRLAGAEVIGHDGVLLTADPDNWSLEVWTKRWNGSQQDGTYGYWQWGFPSVAWHIDDFELNDSHTPLPLSGAVGENVNFFDGPAEDWIPPHSGAVYGVFATNTLPTVTCGSATLAAS